MSYFDAHMSDSLDRWITGNYGEDDPNNQEEEEDDPHYTKEDFEDQKYDEAMDREDD